MPASGARSQQACPGVSFPPIVAAAHEAGAYVVMIWLASTDQLYFASGHLGHPGAMFTASHNPAQYNGIKMCRAGAAPVGSDSGLRDIADLVAKALTEGPATGSAPLPPTPRRTLRSVLLPPHSPLPVYPPRETR